MVKLNRKQLLHYLLFALALCAARCMRELSVPNEIPIPTILGLIQAILYVGLIAVWCASVNRRIVQPQIRVMLECISGLMIFWHLTKAIKYHIVAWFVGQGWMMRYLWYLYYLPLLLIPAFLIMIAFTLRKPESYRLPKKAVIALLSVSMALFLCVITNDLHQLVFDFPADAVVFTDREYTHGVLYYLCFAWIVAGSLIFFAATLKNCRLPNKKFLWLPIAPIVLCIVYSTIYLLGNGVWFVLDFTTMFTFSLVALFEATILVGLIPSNNHYESLLRASQLSAIITDESLSPVYTSHAAVIHNRSMLQKAVENGAVTENGMRLSVYPISGGYAFWQDDMTELSRLIDKLEDYHIDLADQQLVLRESLDTQKKSQSLVEKNRLYNLMQTQTQSKVERLYALAEELDRQTEKAELNRLITEIAVISAYLKRRNNLIFIAEENNILSASELGFCIRESLDHLTRCGVDCDLRFALDGTLTFAAVTQLYDAFETAVEAAMPTLSELFAVIFEDGGSVVLTLKLTTKSDLSPLSAAGFTMKQDGEHDRTLSFALEKGGEGK